MHRILAGQALYPAPSVGYVPDGYPPLYFYVSAAVARVLGASYLTLRLVSLVSSLACFALLARLVQRETGSIAAGTGAAGVFAATYFATGDWFDVGRVDSLFLALSIGGLYAARWMRGTRGAIAAGTLLAAAALTKQTGLAELVAVPAVLLLGPRRGLARVAALTAVAVLGLSTLVLRLTSGGWYIYYVFKQMSEQSLTASNFGWFWTALATAMGLAACAALIGARRVPRELLAGCAALAVEGYATLVHSGGAINDVLPAYLAVALLAGLALGNRSGQPSTGGGLPPWRASSSSPSPSSCWPAPTRPGRSPPSADRAAGERLIAGMRALGGDVAVPGDPSLSLLAGMTPAAHPGRGVRRPAGHRPGRDRELHAQRGRGGQGPAVQRDHHRRRREGALQPARSPQVLPGVPAAAARGPGHAAPPGRGEPAPPRRGLDPAWRFLPARPQHPERR